MISVKNISKQFGQVNALNDISLEIGKGEIVGFLGRNGAGKTTLMRILTSFLPATAGEASVCGHDVGKASLQVRQEIGYLPENPPLYLNMRVDEYLKFSAELKNVKGVKLKSSLEGVLENCDLTQVSKQVIGTLSKGFKQRVGIAQAIIHDPQVLILDEPTTGLDPIQVLHIRNLIQKFKGIKTVILSTHVLSEIEKLVERVFIIGEGRVLKDQRLTDLVAEYGDIEKAFLEINGVKESHE